MNLLLPLWIYYYWGVNLGGSTLFVKVENFLENKKNTFFIIFYFVLLFSVFFFDENAISKFG